MHIYLVFSWWPCNGPRIEATVGHQSLIMLISKDLAGQVHVLQDLAQTSFLQHPKTNVREPP